MVFLLLWCISKYTIYKWFLTLYTIPPRVSMFRGAFRTVAIPIIFRHRPTVFPCARYGNKFRLIIAIVATEAVAFQYVKHYNSPHSNLVKSNSYSGYTQYPLAA